MNVEVSQLSGYRPVVKDKNRNMFSNWVWVEANKLARSSAPYYDGNNDNSQFISSAVVDYLQARLINLVVSLNHVRLSIDQENKLGASGILYHHIPVPDFQSPDKASLINAASRMEGRTSLVWCGYGAGRTGTMVTAWEILTGRKDKETAIDDSTAERDCQKVVLNSLPERRLSVFMVDVCHALRQYRRSRTKGLSMGLGRTASLFGARKASAASINIANALEQMLTPLNVNVTTYGAPVNEADLINCGENSASLGIVTYRNVRQFVEWAAGTNNNVGVFGKATTMGFAEVQQTGQAGATLRDLLRAAIRSFDARRVQANIDKLL